MTFRKHFEFGKNFEFSIEGGPRGRGFGRGEHWGRGHGRRGGRMFDGGEFRLVLLKLIAEQPRHGYDLIRAIEDMTDGSYAPSPGVLYPTLTMLQDMGHIEEQSAEGSRKVFRITPQGEKELAEKAEEVARLFERLDKAGAGNRWRGAVPVGRAMANLGAVIFNRLAHEDADADIAHQMADIIDEAARKIEKL